MSSADLITTEELGPARLAGVAERLAHPGLAFAGVMRTMEAEESSIFERFAGKYVRTGALRASLTGLADGAVRRLTLWGGEFGSAIPYARFQGTTGVGEHGPPSAILRATEAEAAVAARTLLEYIVHGGEL